MRCKKCDVEITEDNCSVREREVWRKNCLPCENERKQIWGEKNRDKTRAAQKKYARKIGIGVECPCKVCGKLTQKHCGGYLCSDWCRFMNMVEKTPTCWLWKGGISNAGYGKFHTKAGGHTSSHRYAYMKGKGIIAEGMHVCHSCDVRLCVNPKHLWLGTAKDNMQDMVKKGRKIVRKGVENPLAKFTMKDVEEIKWLRAHGLTFSELADRFSVCMMTIHNIISGKRYQQENE